MEIPSDVTATECTIAHLWKGEGGFIHVKHKRNVKIRLDVLKEAFDVLKKLSNNRPTGVIIDLTGIHSMDKASRDYCGLESHKSFTTVVVLLISNKFSAVIADFFMGFNKPKYPTKLFTDIREGRKWLKTLEKLDE